METVVLGTASPRVGGIADYNVAGREGSLVRWVGDGNSVVCGGGC